MKPLNIFLAVMCALSWFGLYNKYLDNEYLHQQIEGVEKNNSVLWRELKKYKEDKQ